MVIWLVGLSGAGKTNVGKHLCEIWKKEEINTVLVDGDNIREIFRHNQLADSYTVEGRKTNADRICRLCEWLDKEKINVVCCILSIFEESRRWNRRTYSKYFEVYIKTSMDLLLKRDTKSLYAAAMRGDVKNVVGVDIPFTPPESPDYVFDNCREGIDLRSIALDILTKAKETAHG